MFGARKTSRYAIAYLVFLVLLCGFLVTTAAYAAKVKPSGHITFVSDDDSGVYHEQAIANRSLMSVPSVRVTITHYPAFDPSFCGQSKDACSRPYHLWFDYTDYARTKRIVLHEVGHQFDYFVNDELSRSEFKLITSDNRGWDDQPDSPRERFAEAYSYCSIYGYDPPKDKIIHLGYNLNITIKQYQRICSSIRRSALRHK